MVIETATVSTYAIRVVACEWVCAPFSTLVVMWAVMPSVRASAIAGASVTSMAARARPVLNVQV
ncbi:hypothetical protein MAUB1S_02535 [Mycolicibacterium aubagnense]